MDCTTDFYRSFGELLTKYAALSKVTYKEVSAELGHSPTELVSSIIHHPSSIIPLPSSLFPHPHFCEICEICVNIS
jgi:hypothetical protein